ncbi:hypothetical protein [Alkalibacillus silvisoli]|uniref:Uncharacterized protein n=1 Tax=Alkalibacillus silvisoli TaxID=392823 RepID=A0ABN0ZNY3_9BACI
MTGWVKLERNLLEEEVWTDLLAFRLYTFLLLKASHQEQFKYGGIVLKRGQYIRSYSKLQEDLRYKAGRGTTLVSKSTINRTIKRLVKLELISVEHTIEGTLFTVLNYPTEKYSTQPKHNQQNHKVNDGDTKKETEQQFNQLKMQNKLFKQDQYAYGF